MLLRSQADPVHIFRIIRTAVAIVVTYVVIAAEAMLVELCSSILRS